MSERPATLWCLHERLEVLLPVNWDGGRKGAAVNAAAKTKRGPGHSQSPAGQSSPTSKTMHGLRALSLKEQRARLSPKQTAPGSSAQEREPEEERELASVSEAHEAGAHARKKEFHYTGEPLPWLKLILQGKLRSTPKGNLRAFIEMVGQAKVRPGTQRARTFTSPADGLAAIITGVVLSIVEKYREVGTAAQQVVLDRVLTDHLRLLATPMSANGRAGGHRVEGVNGEGDGLVGPALSRGASVRVETVNQTAVVLVGLQRLRDNPEFKPRHAKIQKEIDELTAEFKALIRHCYKGRRPHYWHYGLSSRLEDESHLKTSWDMLVKLGRSQSKSAAWFKGQADRIARLWPRVEGPWEGLSNQAGSLP